MGMLSRVIFVVGASVAGGCAPQEGSETAFFSDLQRIQDVHTLYDKGIDLNHHVKTSFLQAAQKELAKVTQPNQMNAKIVAKIDPKSALDELNGRNSQILFAKVDPKSYVFGSAAGVACQTEKDQAIKWQGSRSFVSNRNCNNRSTSRQVEGTGAFEEIFKGWLSVDSVGYTEDPKLAYVELRSIHGQPYNEFTALNNVEVLRVKPIRFAIKPVITPVVDWYGQDQIDVVVCYADVDFVTSGKGRPWALKTPVCRAE